MTPDQATRLASATADMALLFRMETDPIVRFWSGAGVFPAPVDAIDPSGADYLGVGALQGFPQVSQLINGISERVTVGLSGLDPNVLPYADEDAEQLRQGARVRFGLLPLDADLQPIDTPLWFRTYKADSIRIQFTSDKSGKQSVTLALSIGSAYTGRKRPPLAYFTDADQRRRSSDDRFFERVALYAQGVTKTWPVF